MTASSIGRLGHRADRTWERSPQPAASGHRPSCTRRCWVWPASIN